MDAAFWEEAWRRDPDQVMVAECVLRRDVASMLPGKALDLGCGNGANALMLAEAGWQVTGIDCAAHAVALAQDAAHARNLSARFLCIDFNDWQPVAHYDLVISTYALPAGAARMRLVQKAARSLSPGGILVIAEWDRSMSSVWGLGAGEFTTAEELAGMLPQLIIEKAERRNIPDMFNDSMDPRALAGPGARVAFLRARKPDSA